MKKNSDFFHCLSKFWVESKHSLESQSKPCILIKEVNILPLSSKNFVRTMV
jgi:hypothetical protein